MCAPLLPGGKFDRNKVTVVEFSGQRVNLDEYLESSRKFRQKIEAWGIEFALKQQFKGLVEAFTSPKP